ncbi:hypothetical protein HZS61_010511 [Fusarium oxysporum f. sp. conglutinans]|uniref:Reverse transcriptase n=1 Tax=Fusarium oxysporum f. sp. conglutinans TaxID=100902 RepID=A0A8H6H1F6_FUSOX|nr:hypothetical protein HZS61_010511 [Fusarium oxysporum f. sp. conglutinans]
MSSNTGPAPPYTGAPPSMAEMMAEIHQMRSTINTLRARVNEQPTASAQTNNTGRDPGEALKPPKPEPFKGQAADVVPFLTRMKGYFRLFQNRLDTPTKKVLFTAPLIQGDAKDWWEPIMRDFLDNEEEMQDQETQNIFTNWENFEKALKDNFGVVNEERQAAAELLALKQHKSCAAYSAKFRQLASKTEWDDEALMEIYYRGLKEEVKDELYLADRPEDLTKYITMAIKIDERQYERRREKANHKRGNDFNPYYPNQRRNDNQGNSRNQGHRRGNRPNNTSYGTQSGPMVLGAVQPGNNHRQRDMSRIKCYNCNKHGHIARDCPEPRRARDPNQGKHTLGLIRQQDPQMVMRTQTLGMTRSGYETVPNYTIKFVEPEPESQPGRQLRVLTEEEKEQQRIRRNEANSRCYFKRMQDPEKKAHERQKQRERRQKKKQDAEKNDLGEPQTLGVIREGKTIPPKGDNQAQSSKAVDDIPMKTITQRDGSTLTVDTEKGYTTKYEAPRFAKTALQKKEEAVKKEREAETKTRTYHKRHSRSMGHRGGAARLAARYLRKEDERLENKWKLPYEPLRDEVGKRMYLSPEDRYIQGAKEHGNTEGNEEIYVRAYHQHDAMNPLHREQKFNKDDDVRTLPTNPNHKDISWVSCKYHWCEHHRQSKEDNDCFPVTIPGTPNDNPYHEWETYGYSVYHWHENLGVATLRFNLAHYRQIHKTKELLEGIKHSQQLIEEAEKEFEKATQGKYADKKAEIMKQHQEWEKEYQEKMADGQYDHLMKKQISIEQIDHPIKWPSTNDASSDTTEELQGQWEDDGLHLRNDPVDLQRRNEITTTEDTDSDESSLEKEHIFKPVNLTEGFDQAPINEEQPGQRITPDERDAELEEHFQQQLFDEEFINDCPNGEGCNDSDCEEQRRERLGSPNALGLCKEPTPKRLVLKVRIKGKWLDAWIDCGAKRNFIDPKIVTRLKLPWRKKKDAYPLINAEGQLFDYNDGIIDQEIDHLKVFIQGKNQGIDFDILPLDKEVDILLGIDWLRKKNPHINWRTGQVTFSSDADSDDETITTNNERSQTLTEEDSKGKREAKNSPPPTGARHKYMKGKKRRNYQILGLLRTQLHDLDKQLKLQKKIEEKEQQDRLKNIPEEYRIYEKLFKEELETKVPQHSRWDHEIWLKTDDLPFQKIYNLNEKELTTLKEYLETELAKGNIRISTSSAGFPVMFVPKKNGKLRLVVDYRKLNALTIKDRTPLPLITELKDRLQGKQIFTALDLKGAYNLIRIKEGDEWKTAFRTKFGLFEYLVMPFGLTNAPATFQRMINNVLRQYLDVFVVCYLDDILIFSDDEEEHKEHVHKVLKALQDANLLVEPEKSHFHVKEVDFLGHTITPGEIRMERKKISAVADWPKPTTVKEVQSFLGFANYYRRFIKDFSKIANPLTELTKKERKFIWLPEAQDAFEQLRQAILSEPVLVMFDPNKEIELETDSSDFALGGQIGQRDDQGKLHPIAFYSHKLHGPELNYPIYDKEFLAIVNCFKEFRHYLMGSMHQIKVYTDHQNISHFATTQELNRRQLRYAEYLYDQTTTLAHPRQKNNS